MHNDVTRKRRGRRVAVSDSGGTAAVQLARKAGCFPILVSASAKNHEALKDIVATECFDYRDPDVVGKTRGHSINTRVNHCIMLWIPFFNKSYVIT